MVVNRVRLPEAKERFLSRANARWYAADGSLFDGANMIVKKPIYTSPVWLREHAPAQSEPQELLTSLVPEKKG